MVIFPKVPLWHYIVGGGVGVVEDGLHELFADFGYAVNVRVYAEAENRGLCRIVKVNRRIPVCGIDNAVALFRRILTDLVNVWKLV